MPFDRAPRQLTGYAPPMRRPGPPAPERDGIFGDTYNGVPNPMIPYQHPYPTRYHGPVFNYPTPGWRYDVAPYARAPFNGEPENDKALDRLLLKALPWVLGALVLSVGGMYLFLRHEDREMGRR